MIEELSAKLADVVCARAEGWPAAELCCAALRSTAGKLTGQPTSNANLKRTYAIRLARPDLPADLIGVDRLLADLDGYPSDELVGFVYSSSSGDIFTMIMDRAVTVLVACFVGRDHRINDISLPSRES